MAPAYDEQPAPFVGTASGRKLAELLGVTPDTLLDKLDVANLATEPIADWRTVKVDEWRAYAEANVLALLPGRVVICAGRVVARALGVADYEADYGHASIIDTTPTTFALTIPHPSVLSRSFDESRCVRALRLALTFAKVDPPYGEWSWRDADAFNAAAGA